MYIYKLSEQLVNAGGDSGSIFRKHLKGPSGTTVDLEVTIYIQICIYVYIYKYIYIW